MKKLFKWVLYVATTICIIMSVFSLIAHRIVTTSNDFETGEQVVLNTTECPCWDIAIPFIVASIIGLILIVTISINNKNKEKR